MSTKTFIAGLTPANIFVVVIKFIRYLLTTPFRIIKKLAKRVDLEFYKIYFTRQDHFTVFLWVLVSWLLVFTVISMILCPYFLITQPLSELLNHPKEALISYYGLIMLFISIYYWGGTCTQWIFRHR
jgi:hypothetical protein